MKNERMKMLVSTCVRDLDSKGMGLSRKSRVVSPRERERHAVSKFRRVVSMKILVKYRKRGMYLPICIYLFIVYQARAKL